MIQNDNIKQNNIFSLFPSYTLEQANNTYKNKNNITVSKPEKDTVIINEKTKSSKRKKIFFGSTIASTILTAGVIGLFFAKGFHGSSYKKLSKYTEKLSREIQDTNLEATKDLANKTALYAKKGTKKTIDALQATSNFTAIKDYICDKLFRKNKATTQFADGSKKGFKKVVDKTLGKKYDKVEVKIKDLTSLLKHYNIANISNLDDAQKMKKVTIKGTTKTLGEWIEILSQQTSRLESAYDDGFSLGARKLRDKKRSGLLTGLSDKIKERFFTNNGLFKAKNYKTYVTEDLTSSAQRELSDDILRAKKQVTNNIPTIHESIKSQINQFSQTINPEDKTSRDTLQLIKQKLELFKKCSGENEAQARNKIIKEISSVIDDASAVIQTNSHYSDAQKTEIIKQLEQIKNSVSSTNSGSKGALEEIMTILRGLNKETIGESGKKIISDSEFKEFSKLSSKISKGIEKATDLERGEYFLKQAELEVGSAPTDVLSVLFPIGAGAYAIAKGDDKDEKISATLTTCIPLVGTFATFVYGTTKMFSGAKNLIFSMVSGLALGKLGDYCDKLYKKYKNSGSVIQVAKDEYDHFLTDITPQYAKSLTKEENKTK